MREMYQRNWRKRSKHEKWHGGGGDYEEKWVNKCGAAEKSEKNKNETVIFCSPTKTKWEVDKEKITEK